MQPYFAPHIAYFQMIKCVDKFIFYDDVNFIKRGWINRNKITVNGKEKLFTIPLKEKSQFKKINEIDVDWESKLMSTFIKTLDMSYGKFKNKNKVIDIVQNIFDTKAVKISELSAESVVQFSKYLGLDSEFKFSSKCNYDKTDCRVKNLVSICKKESCYNYINSIGGKKLYNKDDFENLGINLSFISGRSSLSIIDVCMRYDVDHIREIMEDFCLV